MKAGAAWTAALGSLMILGILFLPACGEEDAPPKPAPPGPPGAGEPFVEGRALSNWMGDFEAGGYAKSARASEVLAEAGVQALPFLSRGLAHDDPAVRRWSAVTLGEIGPGAAQAVPDLVSALEDCETCDAAAQALGRLGEKGLPPLTRLLQSHDPAKRLSAARALAGLGPLALEVLPDLLAVLEYWSLDLSQAVTEALGKMGPGAVSPLITALSSSEGNVREAAARALGKIAPPAREAAVPLRHALEDEEVFVREAAAEGLGGLGPAGISEAEAGLSSPSKAVRLGCLRALRRAGGEGIPALKNALAHQDGAVRIAAADILLSQSCPDRKLLVKVLAELCGTGTGDFRRTAALLLGRLGPDAVSAVPVLIKALEDKDPHLRFASAETLGRIGPAAGAAGKALEKMAQDDAEWVRPAAAMALKRIRRGKGD